MDQTDLKDHAVCFAECLAEELVEVDALRQKRRMVDHLASRDTEKWKTVEKIAAFAGTSERDDKGGVEAASEATTVVGQARHMKLVGLAFSGGGIRSATFNLGVLQGLAQFNKVRVFDYLSTVSGGGYIGNWLEAWILRSGQKQANPKQACKPITAVNGIDVVEMELRPTRTARSKSVGEREWRDQKSHTEPPPIRFLRDYSNYLTPRLGALGADTWTVIAIYLRNLLLNQAILILFLFAILLIPYVAVWLTSANSVSSIWLQPIAVLVLLTLGMGIGARNLHWLLGSAHEPEATRPWLPPQEQRWVIASIVAPVFLGLWIMTAWLWPHAATWAAIPFPYWLWGGILLLGLPFGVASLIAAAQEEVESPGFRTLWWFLESLGTGAVSGLMMMLAVRVVFKPISDWQSARWCEPTLGVPLTLLVFLIAASIQIGLMGRSFCDPYREWWSRVAGWILIFTIVWTAGFGLAFFAPLGMLWLGGWLKGLGLAWIGSTMLGILGGKSDRTGTLDSVSIKDKLLSITPYIFIVGLMSLLSLSLELILARCYLANQEVNTAWNALLSQSSEMEKAANFLLNLHGNATSTILTLSGTASSLPTPHGHALPLYAQAHFVILRYATNWLLIPVCAAVLLLCLWLSFRVDLNEFSMNLMYRNRLTRCYLGATHQRRMANPFSGLDCCDDLFLSRVRSSECYSGPLPILNTSLNLVNTRELAWQERKAESFPMTPLRCGFDTWIEQTNLENNYDVEKHEAHISKYAYRPTAKYGYEDNGFYMGTAMSISGAAASPNMGYHSQPSLALLMTFFNVRLGFWAGNPRNKDTWTHPGPTVGLGQLLCELFGLTNDNAKYVYLSDGGHFENLGVYELVKRRCKYIVACDAGADPHYSFEDLGNAIRKCREDIGVEIELDTTPLTPKPKDPNGDRKNKGGDSGNDGDQADNRKMSSQHCLVGRIRYDMADPEGEPGVIVYLKASLTGDEPADVFNYQTMHPTFPHESTTDQWFSESQFESYRRLGQHIVEMLFAGRKDTAEYEDPMSEASLGAIRALGTNQLFEKLEKKWAPATKTERDQKRGSSNH